MQANQAPRVRPVLERRAYGAYLSAGQLASSLRIGVKCRAQDVPLITHVQCSGRKARSRDDSHSMPASRFEGRPTRLAEWNSLRAQEGTCGFVREQCDSDPWPSCVEACEVGVVRSTSLLLFGLDFRHQLVELRIGYHRQRLPAKRGEAPQWRKHRAVQTDVASTATRV